MPACELARKRGLLWTFVFALDVSLAHFRLLINKVAEFAGIRGARLLCVKRGCWLAQAWGWVLEMYAFTIACYMEGLPTASLHIKMMAQPPWDTKLWP